MVKIILSTVTNIFYSENKFMARKVIKIINFLVIIILLTTITKKIYIYIVTHVILLLYQFLFDSYRAWA